MCTRCLQLSSWTVREKPSALYNSSFLCCRLKKEASIQAQKHVLLLDYVSVCVENILLQRMYC